MFLVFVTLPQKCELDYLSSQTTHASHEHNFLNTITSLFCFVLFKLTHPKHFPFHYAVFNNSLQCVGMFCLWIQFFLHLLRTYFLVNIRDAVTPNTHGKKYRKVSQSDSVGTYSNKVDFYHTRVPVLTNRVRDSNSKLN